MKGFSELKLPCVPKRHHYLYCHTRCVSPTYDARAAAYCLPALVTLEAIEPKGIPGCCVDPFRVKLLTGL
ncbi:hypothetical protein R3I93_015354 [Phoxinus phoxinus]|uniref:Uncharacterized protein n=1 Tax=Phoxinus phoxinus TaxID=58324 RepID=A0AAN9CNA6_9TELE